MNASVPTPQAADLPADLLALSSLNTREGVRRIGGKVDAYHRQLRRFREHYADSADKLQSLISAQGPQNAEAYCHMLKGITGNLGALALYAQISAIDRLLKQSDAPPAAELNTMRTLLQAVMQDIDSLGTSVVQPAEPSLPFDASQLDEHLLHLKQALDYDLGSAERLLAQLRNGVVGTPLEPEISAIAAKVDIFEIDAAQILLAQLQDRLKNKT